jgi:hypothetical protein
MSEQVKEIEEGISGRKWSKKSTLSGSDRARYESIREQRSGSDREQRFDRSRTEQRSGSDREQRFGRSRREQRSGADRFGWQFPVQETKVQV